jgi:hypothetical protein
VTAPLPTNVGTGIVTGHLAKFLKLTSTDAEGQAPIQGVVTFTPQVTRLVDAGNAPKTIFVSDPIPVQLVNGSFSVELVATDDTDLNPTGFKYLVSFNLTGAKLDPLLMQVPQGTTQDLVDVINGTAPGAITSFLITDNGDGTVTFTGSGVTSNSDGTITLTGTGITDNGDGTFTVSGT